MTHNIHNYVSVRTANILLSGGITTLEQAAETGAVGMLKLPNFGKSSLAEVVKAMRINGLSFELTPWQRGNPTYASLKYDLSNMTNERDALRKECDAWKARIAGAMVCIAAPNLSIPRMGIAPGAARIIDDLPIDWIGKAIALVLTDQDETTP